MLSCVESSQCVAMVLVRKHPNITRATEPVCLRTLVVPQSSAVEAACVILSVDETVRNPKSETDPGQQAMRGPGAMRGRGMR
jgi:hypothetical protein